MAACRLVTERFPEPPSAGVLLDALIAERQIRLESIDAMTNRAGTMLRFTGALVALTALLEPVLLRFAVFVPAAVTTWHCFKALHTVLLPGVSPMLSRDALVYALSTESVDLPAKPSLTQFIEAVEPHHACHRHACRDVHEGSGEVAGTSAQTVSRRAGSGHAAVPEHRQARSSSVVFRVPAARRTPFAKRRYSDGTTNRLSNVAVTRPPRITTAIGCSIS